ncbi:hypothetical protein PEPS_07010 [Persicobacter psychrovividus]|uniref:Carbohydrate-binding domain-containing protein n=1 Tax=Persicobacter psychrovividus TaxID=387638 RepID=A0ABM7VBX0_9BACT|nr:hypothetical protein PEPS_07010 [Persicobacter psychrovividus]
MYGKEDKLKPLKRNFLMMNNSCWIVFLAFLIGGSAYAQGRAKGYVCYRTDQPINIDGKADEAVWNKVPWTNSFRDIEGDSRPLPKFDTKVKMLWDDEYLYFYTYLEEPDLWATLTERESIIYLDNDFEVFIDPNNDGQHYYEFEINALGTEWDLLLTQPYRFGGKPVFDWDIKGMKTAVHLDGTLNDPSDKDRGWGIEIAMPWSSLNELSARRAKPKSGEQWRLNFSRVQYELHKENGQYVKVKGDDGKPLPEYNWVWVPTGKIDMHRPNRWGYLQFSDLKAGDGKEDFIADPDYALQQYLFTLIDEQRKYKAQHGHYTELANLQVEEWAPEKAVAVQFYDGPVLSVGASNAARTKRYFVTMEGKLIVENLK